MLFRLGDKPQVVIKFEAISLSDIGFNTATFAIVPSVAEIDGVAEQ